MIPILIFARQQSERCKEKALRPFHGDISLTELALEKLSGRKDVYLAAREPVFEEMADKYDISFWKRDERSVMGETLERHLLFHEGH